MKWLTYPVEDGYYWLCEDDQPGGVQAMIIVHVWNYSDGRFVEFVGSESEIEPKYMKGRWLPIPIPDPPEKKKQNDDP